MTRMPETLIITCGLLEFTGLADGIAVVQAPRSQPYASA